MKKPDIILSVLVISLLVAASGCSGYNGCSSDEKPLTLDEVHEWGVFVQDYGSGNSSYSGGPTPGNAEMPVTAVAKMCKPVIYFHGEGKGSVALTITANVSELITIPGARVVEESISWKIKVAGGVDRTDNFSSEAVVVAEDDKIYEYLFYEGEIPMLQPLTLNITRDSNNLSFNLSNNGEKAIGNVFVLYHPGNGTAENFTLWQVPSMAADEWVVNETTINSSLSVQNFSKKLETALRQRGLTSDETQDLLDYWVDGVEDELGLVADELFFESPENETVSIIYFLSGSAYNELLPITVSPQPDALVRVGLVWLRNVPVEVVE